MPSSTGCGTQKSPSPRRGRAVASTKGVAQVLRERGYLVILTCFLDVGTGAPASSAGQAFASRHYLSAAGARADHEAVEGIFGHLPPEILVGVVRPASH